MAMLEYLNAAACMVLLIYCVPVAAVMQAQHKWSLWTLFIVVVLCLTLQIVDPFAVWVPAAGWPSVMLNAVAAVALTLWRKEAWLFARCRLGPPPEIVHPLRRVSDLSAARSISHTEGIQIRGRGAE